MPIRRPLPSIRPDTGPPRSVAGAAARCETTGARRWLSVASVISCLLASLLTLGADGPGHRQDGREARERLEFLRARARATFLKLPAAAGYAGLRPGTVASEQPAGIQLETLPSAPEVQASGGVFGTQSETTIAVSGNNVVVGFNQINGNRGCGLAYSVDGGLSFTDTGGIPSGPSPNRLLGDPSLTVCPDGTFYYACIQIPSSGIWGLTVSAGTFTGQALSWTDPIPVEITAVDFLDKPWLDCDRAGGTLHLAYTRFVNGNAGPTTEMRIETVRSADGAVTWTSPLVLESSTTESVHVPYVATGPDGEVYVLWERGLDDLSAAVTKLELRRSLNGGVGFDPRVTVREMIPSFFPASVGFNRERMFEVGSLAVDRSMGPHRGRVYAIWMEREQPGRWERDILVATSGDQGATWSEPVRVNDDAPGRDQVMPWLAVNAAGAVEAVWYDYRNWPGMHTTDILAARSLDGGTTFGPNFRVTSVPTSWFVPLTITPNFGDYIGATAPGTDLFAAWADGRNNEIDVFAARAPTGTCGNGSLDPFEQCDDGNVADGDACSGGCAAIPCGDGNPDPGEACDDGNPRSGDGCSETCRLEVCGDGILQRTRAEECDDGNTASGDGCSSTCAIELERMAWIVEERSRLLLQSVVSGASTTVGDPGFHEMGDLAFAPDGALYGVTGFNPSISIGFNGVLLEMDALGLPGRSKLRGSSGWNAVQAIDFHPVTGILFGIGVDIAGTSRLVRLDPATGATLVVAGDLGLNTARAMAFDAAGTLYVAGRTGATGGASLYTVDPDTAATTLIGPIPHVLAGMDFAPDGTLYGVVQRGTGNDRVMVTVDPSTGTATPLPFLGAINQAGIRFAPAAALDRDLDGVRDALDCSPSNAANVSPGLASGLGFPNASGTTLVWTAAPDARHHNLYRGTIAEPLGTRAASVIYDHTCFESADAQGNGDLFAADPSLPPLGASYYYVAGGEGCGDGPLDSGPMSPIPNPSPCPTPP
jgi:cysteine-rich repeat protein